jgi:hypothetical protein
MNSNEVREAIINHIKKTGRCPNYKSVGGWEISRPVFDAMIADGTLIWEQYKSPKGRNMTRLTVAA